MLCSERSVGGVNVGIVVVADITNCWVNLIQETTCEFVLGSKRQAASARPGVR